MTSPSRPTLFGALAVSLSLALSLGACERSGGPPAPQPVEPPAAPAAAAPTSPHAGTTAPHAATTSPHAGATTDDGVTGKILETMDSGGYTYVRLATATGEQWAAVPAAKVTVGATVTIAEPMVMTNFESKTLGRTFDKVLFGSLAGAAAAAPAGSAGAQAPAAVAAPVARAEGADARTVAEVFAQKAALAGKPVVLRGKVTKFNGGIMGKNWLHVQDGSGSPGTGDFDLTVTTPTTAAPVAVGDVVVVRGVVQTDQDFGGGYVYAVLLADATVTK